MPVYDVSCETAQFKTACCAVCLEQPSKRVRLYAPSMFGDWDDSSLGLKLNSCCAHIHDVQHLPRRWWVEQYLRVANQFTDIEKDLLLNAQRGVFHTIYTQIHDAARKRHVHQIESHRSVIKLKDRSKSGCPDCGNSWNEVVCDSCGYTS